MQRTAAVLFGLALLAGLGATQAQATPTCTTTTTVANGDTVTAAALLTAGTCVEAGDKIFGDFAISGSITGNGSASFTFFTTPGNVTVGFAGVVGPNVSGTVSYEVQVDPALSQGFLINGIEADFTLNAAASGPASAALTASTNPLTSPSVTINCSRTVNPAGGTCPETQFFAPVADLTLTQTITTGPNAIVTAITDTFSQVPEPGTLLLLGSSLVGLALIARRR
jgi:PEP-CTERM motif